MKKEQVKKLELQLEKRTIEVPIVLDIVDFVNEISNRCTKRNSRLTDEEHNTILMTVSTLLAKKTIGYENG